MYDYKLLEAFTAVIENQGFEKAAEVLYITQSAVSQRIRQLEDYAGQILLVRSSPPVPTEAGKKLAAHFKKVRLLESELELTGEESSGVYHTLSVGLNADSLSTWFFNAVEDAVLQNNILLDLHVDDQDETHRMLKDGEVAGCISTRSKSFQSCTCTFIGNMTYKMYSSANIYEDFFSRGLKSENLKDVPVIIYNEKDTLHLQIFRKAFNIMPTEYPKMFIPDQEQYKEAVIRGFGIGMMPVVQCEQLEKDGLLYSAFHPFTVETPLYWHRWSIASRQLETFTKTLLSNHSFY